MSPSFTFEPESGELTLGRHDVRITGATSGVNSKGNTNLRVTFEAPDGAVITEWLVHLPQSRWRWRQLWEAAGLEFPEEGGEVDSDDLIDRTVEIEVITDEYQGQQRRAIGDIGEAQSGPGVPEGTAAPSTARQPQGGFAAAAGVKSDDEVAF